MHVELRERFAEIEATRKTEAMNRARAVLAEIYLVDIREHDLVLAVPQLEHERHRRFADLARVRLAVAQEVAAHELHREGAAALIDFTGPQVRERRANHRA